jgi:acetoin:2,6-dichlorophenolindophenol oxidoreductase subunit alpha
MGMALETAALLRMYRMMLLIRRFEERAVELLKAGEIKGSLHPCVGQEATAVGACAALLPTDYMTCTYRGHGQCLAKGFDPREALAELLGRRTGCSKGKGGSMHYTDPRIGLLGENAIVGAGVPIAAGAALAAQMDGDGRIALTFFGDGAVNQGLFAEAINLAAIWQLPLILFCENNQYSEMTPIAKMARTSLRRRVEGYGIPGVEVDGNDVEAVYEVTHAAVDQARAGDGPTFIEAHTYRLLGHMVGDSEVYRSKEEVAEWRERRDPIQRTRTRLGDQGVGEGTLHDIEQSVTVEIDAIETFAKRSPYPEADEIWDDVWAV